VTWLLEETAGCCHDGDGPRCYDDVEAKAELDVDLAAAAVRVSSKVRSQLFSDQIAESIDCNTQADREDGKDTIRADGAQNLVCRTNEIKYESRQAEHYHNEAVHYDALHNKHF